MSSGDANAPLIAVIIVHFHAGGRLARVLAALETQVLHDFDVVIVDNGSAPGELDPLARPGVKIVRPGRNLGFAEGCNHGAAATRAPLLVFLNPDAYPAPDWLSALATAARTYGPGTALGSVQLDAGTPTQLDGLGDVYHVSGVAWRGGFGRPATARPDGDREIFAACFAAALVHRVDFDALGGLDPEFFCYHEDVDFGFRLRLRGGRAILVHNAEVLHEGSGTTGRYSPFTVYHGIRNRLWTLAKNMPAPLLPLAIPAYLAFSIIFLIRSFMLGIGVPFCNGTLAGIAGLGNIVRKRRMVQASRKASSLALLRAMRLSPFAPLRRAPDLRAVRPMAGASPDRSAG